MGYWGRREHPWISLPLSFPLKVIEIPKRMRKRNAFFLKIRNSHCVRFDFNFFMRNQMFQTRQNSSPCPNSCPAFAPRGNTIRDVIENLFNQDHTLLLICMCPWLVGSSGLWITFLYSIDNFILHACSWIDFHWTFVCAGAYVWDTLTEAKGQLWDLLFLGSLTSFL